MDPMDCHAVVAAKASWCLMRLNARDVKIISNNNKNRTQKFVVNLVTGSELL